MSKKDDALKLAREALEYISSHYMSLPKIGCMALAAIEEALAEQPAQQYSATSDHRLMENAQGELERITLVQTGVGIGNPKQKTCLVANEPCKHGSWCSEVYCQEHCKFVEQPAQQWNAGVPSLYPEPEPGVSIKATYEQPAQPLPWHHPDCEGECIACLIEREVTAAYGTQGLAYLRRHVSGGGIKENT